MATSTPYTFGTTTQLPLDETRARVEAVLGAEGFGVLTARLRRVLAAVAANDPGMA